MKASLFRGCLIAGAIALLAGCATDQKTALWPYLKQADAAMLTPSYGRAIVRVERVDGAASDYVASSVPETVVFDKPVSGSFIISPPDAAAPPPAGAPDPRDSQERFVPAGRHELSVRVSWIDREGRNRYTPMNDTHGGYYEHTWADVSEVHSTVVATFASGHSYRLFVSDGPDRSLMLWDVTAQPKAPSGSQSWPLPAGDEVARTTKYGIATNCPR